MAVSTSRFGRIRYPKITLKIDTEHSDYHITNDYAAQATVSPVDANTITNGVVSFQTTNDLGDDSATFSIILAGDTLWDRLINANDIITILVDPGEREAQYEPANKNIFTGLVSEVRIEGSYDSDSKMYQITGQSMAKVFSQYKIGMVSTVESQLSGIGWLWDSGIDLDKYYTDNGSSDDDDGSSGSHSASGSSLKVKVDTNAKPGTAIARAIAKPVAKAVGVDAKYVFAQIMMESHGEDLPGAPAYSHKNLTGMHGGAAYSYSSWSDYASEYATTLKNDGVAGAKSVTEYATALKKAGYFGASLSSYITGMNSWVGKYDGSSDDSSSTSGSDSTSSSTVSGGTSAEAIDREVSSSQGISLFGNDVAEIETNIINRFKDYLSYTYDNGAKNIFDFFQYTGFTSWAEEQLRDSSSFTNFTGSLYELQQAALRQPFNEMFYEFNAQGQCQLIIRRTPFQPDDWANLGVITMDSTAVLSEDIGKSDSEQYSVFVDNPASTLLQSLGTDSFGFLSYPQTNQRLIDKYGYAKLEVDDLYVAGANDTDMSKSGHVLVDNKVSKSSDNTKGTHYDLNAINGYLNGQDKTTLRQEKAKVATNLANKANNISAAQAASLVNDYVTGGYQNLSEDQYNADLSVIRGGDISNTGTHKLTNSSFKKVRSLLNKGTTERQFAQSMMSYYKNISFEFIDQLFSNYGSGSNNMSDKEFKSALKSYKSDKDGDSGNSTSGSLMDTDMFQTILYNWYANNFNWWSGTYTVVGNPDIRLGTIFQFQDTMLKAQDGYPGRRFYIESVSHNFSFTEGYTTDIGVTRGLIAQGSGTSDVRFSSTYLWNTGSDFLGGYMGEASVNNLAFASDGSSSGSGGTSSSDLVAYAETFQKDSYKMPEVYALGGYGERGSTNPLENDINGGKLILDCSSFIYWCLKHKGITSGTTTWSLRDDTTNFNHVTIPGNTTDGMKEGDLVFLYNCNHVMLYAGGNNLIGWNGGGSGTNASYDPTGGCKLATLTAMGGSHDGMVCRLKA